MKENQRIKELRALFNIAALELGGNDTLKITMKDLQLLLVTLANREQEIKKLRILVDNAHSKLARYYAEEIPSLYDFKG